MDENQNRKVKTAKGYKKSNENNLICKPTTTRYSSRELTHSATNQRSKNNLIGRPAPARYSKGIKRSGINPRGNNSLIGRPTPVKYSRELRHSTSNESCGTSQTQKSDKKDD